MDKECLECGEPIQGRVDKKYCSDLCRNTFNNRLNSTNNSYMRNVNNILKRNRKILEEMIPTDITESSCRALQQRGFNFGYYTHIHTNKKGEKCFFCYEFGYLPLENDQLLLMRKNEYAELV